MDERAMQRLTEAVAAQGGEVAEVRPLHGGACQDNFVVACTDGRRWVLRSDAPSSLPGSLDRAREAEVVKAAVRGGVPTPAVRAVLPDLLRDGATAVLLDWADGVAIGAKIVRNTAIHPVLLPQLATALARVHAIRPEDAPDVRPDNPQNADDIDAVAAALRFCRTMMDRLPARPAAERIYAWLDANRPDPGPKRLVHGDYRVGNFLVGENGLNAVLDWEFAHWGSAGEDLAWLTVRDWRFGRLDQPVGGIGKRADFLRAYREAGGEPPDADALLWWEVLGNLRWATGALFQTVRVLSGAQADLELLAIGRRAVEMEWEALRRAGILGRS